MDYQHKLLIHQYHLYTVIVQPYTINSGDYENMLIQKQAIIYHY